MTEIVVQKYGGSSVATIDKIKKVALKIKKRVENKEKIVVVVSAMGKTTNELIKLAEKISVTPEPRELDMILSTGEQVSAALLSMALNSIDVKAISYNAFQLQIYTTNIHASAKILDINEEKIFKSFDNYDVIVVTGFQGIDEMGNITTLGRGGSDTSAVAFAAKTGAKCEIYSDFPGIFTCDPRMNEFAKKLDYITFDEMLELSALGANVLHSRAVEIAKKYSLEMYCASTFSEERGTFIVDNLPEWLEQPVVTGVTMDNNQTKITIYNIPNKTGIFSRIFDSLAKHRINVDMISIVYDEKVAHLTFSVISANREKIRNIITDELKSENSLEFNFDENVSKISAVGVGMKSSSGVAARFFSALDKKGIKILATTTSEIKISALVSKENSGAALKELIDEFNL